MKISECQVLLATTLSGTTCSAQVGSPYERIGRAVLRMASSYESDGGGFLSAGDPVNALAAFLYGLGWLHCGTASGLLISPGEKPACPFQGQFEKVPASQYMKLDEKTRRYAHLLTTAIASVAPAPAPGTASYAFALQVRFIAEMYLQRGNVLTSSGKLEEGLACFSYGHGWLDAGVEDGLFAILAHQEIFTVD